MVLVQLHVESLNLLGVVGHDDGLLEVDFSEVTLMFRAEIQTPVGLNFELVGLSDLGEDVDGFGVGEVDEGVLKNVLQTVMETLVNE